MVYLEADTCVKCFAETPELTVSVGNNVGVKVPIEDTQVFLEEDPGEARRTSGTRSGWTCA